MSNRRQLLNMYPNWLQSLVRAVLLENIGTKMGSKISGALIGRITSSLRKGINKRGRKSRSIMRALKTEVKYREFHRIRYANTF